MISQISNIKINVVIILVGLLLLFSGFKGFSQKTESIKKPDYLENLPVGFPLIAKDFKKISSFYGYRKHPFLNKVKLHSGIDLVAQKGSAVIATASGIVEKTRYQKGYGNHIIIGHLFSLKTLYAHLWLTIVKVGDFVFKGQLIGFVGDTGMATGPHLHYEIQLKNKKINPSLIWKSVTNTK